MKLLLISTLIIASTQALAFCNLNDQACQQTERMLQLQQEQLRQQQAYQQEQLRQHGQNMANSAINQNRSSGGLGYYDATNGRHW